MFYCDKKAWSAAAQEPDVFGIFSPQSGWLIEVFILRPTFKYAF